MRNPANSKLRTAAVMGLLLFGAGAPFAAAQTSAPQQLNDLRKQVNQAGQPASTQTQSKPASPAPQSAAKPQAPATNNSAQAKTSSPSPAQTKPSAAPANPAAAKAPAGKPGAVSTAAAAQAKPGTQPPAKVVSVKPTNELAPRGQPVPAAKTPAAVATTKTVAAPGAQPKATPAVAEVPNASVPEHVSRRDPFDPLVDKTKDNPSGPQAPLPAGKPGLVVSSLRIDGIVKGNGGMIAIVSNPQMRVYFLREGDHLYDGEVQHITMEGVAFHQTGKDAFGKPVEREVTKRLYPTPGEQQ
jgi:hypothetical protein